MGEEGLDVPRMFGGDLRQQKTTTSAVFDDQAVSADGNLVDGRDVPGRRHDGNLDCQLVQLIQRDRGKPWIRIRHGTAKVRHHVRNSPIGLQPAEAPSQVVAAVNRDEGPAGRGECPACSRGRLQFTPDPRLEGAARDGQQTMLILRMKHGPFAR